MADLFTDVPHEEKVAHLKREITMRRLVAQGRMKQHRADRGIQAMEAILADYEQGRVSG